MRPTPLAAQDRSMDARAAGLLVAAVGLVVVVVGLLIWAGLLGWFGRLPGDIRIEREHTRVYIPLVSMLLLSVVLSLALWVLRRLF
jgi:membrane protein DedA with SNARE-associated domain